MARFDRFKKIESARPDAPDGDASPQSSMRFGKIEARKDAPAPPPHDPFAPPPDDADAPLEIATDDVQDQRRIHAEREDRAKAQLAAEAQRVAEMRMRQEAESDSVGLALAKGPDALMKLSREQRATLAGGALAVTAVLALTVSKLFWGLAPLVVIVFFASLAMDRNR